MANWTAILNASLMLQSLQGLSVLYFLIPFGMYISSFFWIRKFPTKVDTVFLLVLVYLLFRLYIIYLSFNTIDLISLIEALARDVYVLPIFFITYLSIKKLDDFTHIIRFYIFIIILGALSLFWQYLFGPVFWFDDPSVRHGLSRYSSLLGALPIFGVAGGLALALIPLFAVPFTVKFLCSGVIVVGMMFTLQKAAAVNLVLLFILYLPAFLKLAFLNARIFLSLIIFSSVFFITIFKFFIEFWQSFLSFLGVTENLSIPTRDSTSLYVDAFDRFLGGMIADVTWFEMMSGIGYLGGGGVFGLDSGYSGHNAFIDLLLVGGIVYFIIFLAIFVTSIIKLKTLRLNNSIDKKTYFALRNFFILFLINFPFFSGMLVSPSIAGVFWICVACISKLSMLNKKVLC